MANAGSKWSNLPSDLLVVILGHLHTLQDFFSVAAVCKKLFAATVPSASSLASQSPLLLISSVPPPDKRSESLYDISARRLYPRPLPWTPSNRFTIAYSHGHFITVIISNKDLHEYNDIIFYNLFTFHPIKLPQCPEGFDRAIISARPDLDPAKCFVVTFSYETDVVQYLRVDNSQWTTVEIDSFLDMMFLEGDLLVLNNEMEVITVNLMEVPLRFRKLWGGPLDYIPDWNSKSKDWLGELDGVMLTVTMYYSPIEFVVHMWNSEKEWVYTEDLGDRALFVCDKAVSISTTGLRLRKNCVYYLDTFPGPWIEYSLKGQNPIWVTIDDLDVSPETHIEPVWVFPNYC